MGPKGKTIAAWAAVIIFTDGLGNETSGGFIAGPVVLSLDQKGFIGATKGTSGTSELSAEAWAAMLILQQGWRCGITIEYDSKYAAGIAAGIYGPKANKSLASIVTGLFSLAMNQTPIV